ncbi:RRP5-like protein [Chlorella sorokiniana]|uniref:RRP5-like protein n=1 Tax=Chlorella sorokiniana TaxID=3076 RepID=A0A2P6TE27_CHLSO|nr:RRP5-like protein [Chlorella sorokiniana]|eukprot:PRW20900.1 RRP5-like protein [Chlorella sorokiniana]
MGPAETKGKKRQAPQPSGEEEFVRGGGSGLAAIEKKRLEQEAYAEAEADLAAAAKKGGGKRRRKAGEPAAAGAAAGEAGDDEDAFFSSLSAQGRLPKFVELLKFKSLSKGCKLWGAVIELTPRELVVSLPHGLRGHVAYAEASDWLAEQSKKAEKAAAAAAADEDAEGGAAAGRKRKAAAAAGIALPPLSDLFHIGQLVRCTVTGLRTGAAAGEEAGGKQGGKQGSKGSKSGSARKRVDLSLRVSKMNAGLGAESLKEGLALPACVRSVEDHGYLLALGVKGVSGFLPKKDAEAAGRLLAPGMLVEVVVGAGGLRPAGGASIVTVTCKSEAVAAAAAKEWDGLNIGSLLPGQLVTARVRNVLSDGLLTSFLTYFSGTVDPFHLGADLAADWRKQFSPNQRLRARILYVDPAAKRVGLTLQRHLLAFTLPPNFPMLGQIFDSAVVRRVDEGLGLLCELPAEGLPLAPGYAHISNLADSKVEDLTAYRPGQRVRARVLGFRPMDGLAVLTTKPSVVDQSVASVADLRPSMPVSGSVVRVEDYGLLVAITPSIRALVPVLHASDLGSAKGLKKYKEGQKVAGKVLSVDTASKKVTLTLKPSVVGSKLAPITCLQAAVPGGRSHGVVTGTADFGVFVQFFGGVAGLAHVSECGLEAGQKPGDAFQPGQVVKCRVLGADPGRKGLKLSLVSKSKKAAATATEAAAGEPAAAGAAEAPAEEQQQQQKGEAAGGKAGKKKRGADGASDAAAIALGSYQPGDLVRGTVTAVHTKEVDGQVVPDYFELAVAPAAAVGTPPGAASTPAIGRLEIAHLADHPAAASALAAALTVGSQLGPLLVLQRMEGAKQLRLSRKGCLLEGAAAGLLPASTADVAEGALLPGYVASVTEDAVFVRFLGGLTGRAGLAQLSDTFVSDPHLFFREGQSVRATVVQVDRERNRFSVALKQSLCGGKDAAYLRSLFSDLEEAARLSSEGADVDWATTFPIGGVVPGEVHAAKDYGLLCDLAAHEDVVGLAATHQVPAGASQEPGTTVQAVVLDVNKKDGIVDLSLQTALLQRAQAAAAAAAAAEQQQQQQPKKKQKQKKGAAATPAAAEAAEQGPQLQEGQQVAARIELVKAAEGYCVVSLTPATPAEEDAAEAAAPPQQQQLLGFFAVADFNLQQQAHAQVARQFEAGSRVDATVAALPSPATGGRLLLSVPLAAKPVRAARAAGKPAGAAGSKAESRPAAPAVGSCVQATVSHVHPLHADLTLEGGAHGRLHITEAAAGSAGASPLAALTAGDQLEVAVLGRVQTAEGRRHGLLECSSRPDVVAAAKAGQQLPRHVGWATLKRGQPLPGFVQEVGGGLVWCAFSPTIRGRAYATQAASSVKECEKLESRFKLGTPVQATVLHVDGRKHALDVSLLPASSPAAAAQPPAGTLVLGRVTAVGGGSGGLRVQLSARSTGRVTLTDIHDAPVQQALAGLQPGQYCRAAVLGPDPTAAGSKRKGGDNSQLLLSLRPSAGGQCAAHAAAQQQQGDDTPQVSPGALTAEQLKQGQRVAGYVKSAGQAGVFVALARNLDARIRLGQLSDGFVEDPAVAFPEGSLVVGQVLATEGGKVELTLRQRKVGPSLESLEEGQVVRGAVKQVAKYGVFVQLEGSPGVTGLAHVSELADDFVKDPAALFNPGQRVVARVLKVDAAANRLSLGLKPSYFEDISDLEDGEDSEEEPDFDAELATAGTDSSDDEEVRAILRGAGGGGADASGSEDEDEEAEAGGSDSGSEDEGAEEEASGSGSEDERGDAEEVDSDEEFDLDEAASGGSDDE